MARMAAHPTTRRQILALTLFSCAGATMPFSALAAEEPAWLTDLSNQLEQLSVHVRRQTGTGGMVEFHCAMRDAATWATSFSKLAVEKTKVRAGGSALTFSREGRSVRVVMVQV